MAILLSFSAGTLTIGQDKICPIVFNKRRIIMSEIYDPIDLLVSELKRNTGFIEKMLFPEVSLLLGTMAVMIALVLIFR
jgi:hypothetical protein